MNESAPAAAGTESAARDATRRQGTGKRTPKFSHLSKIADALKRLVEWFLSEDELSE